MVLSKMANYEYTKVSEITVSYLANYLRLSEVSSEDTSLLETIIESAKNYVLNFSGVTLEVADTYPEFTIATLVLCEDMFDKRTYSIDKSESNKVVDNILGLHSINLL